MANERSGSSDPDACARAWRRPAQGKRFDIEQLERAVRHALTGWWLRVATAASPPRQRPRARPASRWPWCGGMANDFLERLGLPSDVAEACELAVNGTRLRELELGWINQERPFVNVASAGLPAPAARAAGAWKRLLGPLAYGLGALRAGLTAKPLRCLVDCDGGSCSPAMPGRSRWRPRARSVRAAVEEADPSDGLLEVVAIEAGPRLGLVGLAYGLRTSRVTDHPRAFHASCTTSEVLAPDDRVQRGRRARDPRLGALHGSGRSVPARGRLTAIPASMTARARSIVLAAALLAVCS